MVSQKQYFCECSWTFVRKSSQDWWRRTPSGFLSFGGRNTVCPNSGNLSGIATARFVAAEPPSSGVDAAVRQCSVSPELNSMIFRELFGRDRKSCCRDAANTPHFSLVAPLDWVEGLEGWYDCRRLNALPAKTAGWRVLSSVPGPRPTRYAVRTSECERFELGRTFQWNSSSTLYCRLFCWSSLPVFAAVYCTSQAWFSGMQ